MTKNQTSAVIGAVISFVIAILTIFGYNVLVVQPALEATPAPAGAVVGSRGVTNFDDIDTLNVTGPTAIATATPVAIFDNLGAGNVIVSVRDAATPVWEVRNGGAVYVTGAVTLAGGYGDTGCTVSATGALSCNGAITTDGTVTAAGVNTTLTVLSKTADYTVQTTDTGSVIRTTNAITLTLPGAAVGLNFCIYNGDGSDLVLDPPDGADYVLVLTNAGGDRLTNTTIGDSVCLVGIDNTHWIALQRIGTWSDGN